MRHAWTDVVDAAAVVGGLAAVVVGCVLQDPAFVACACAGLIAWIASGRVGGVGWSAAVERANDRASRADERLARALEDVEARGPSRRGDDPIVWDWPVWDEYRAEVANGPRPGGAVWDEVVLAPMGEFARAYGLMGEDVAAAWDRWMP